MVTRFLSSKFFIHTNKLTYGIYLLNPLIITAVFGLSDGSANADPIPTVIVLCSISYISAYLCTVGKYDLYYFKTCTTSHIGLHIINN